MMVSWNALAAASFWWSTPTVGEAESPSEPEPTRKVEMCSIDDLEWAEMIEDAFESYMSMDIEKFETKRDKVHEYSFCLSSIVTARTVGDFHKMEVLYSFMAKDKASFAAHVRAAELADPAAPLSTAGLVNDGHPILQWYALAKEEKVATRIRLPIPDLGHSIFIDGASAVGYPSDLPYIFQHVVDGVVEYSGIISLDMDVPSYPVYVDPTLRIGLEPTMTWVSAGSLGLTLTTALVASRAESKFWNPATPDADLVRLRRRANVYSSFGVVSGLATVGAIGAAYWKGTHSVAAVD